MTPSTEKLLELNGLQTHFFTQHGVIKAVDDVSFFIERGEVIGLVGESGCGKSVTSLSILRMVPEPSGRIVGGKILYLNENLLEKSEEEMRQIRGNRISMILQDPMVALNQLLKIGYQLGEPLRYHGKEKGNILQTCIDLLKKVQVPSPETRVNEYPFQFSGGMCQRTIIGMAIGCEPDLLIADEPTTALDVTIQAQMLRLLRQINKEFNTSIIIITHDLALAAQICTRIIVMYAGKIIETAPVKVFYENPAHPYSYSLIRSVPIIGRRVDRLYTIEGQPPNLLNPPPGCRFAPRCEQAKPGCELHDPPVVDLGDGHSAACWLCAGG